jgi:hypothetical protein
MRHPKTTSHPFASSVRKGLPQSPSSSNGVSSPYMYIPPVTHRSEIEALISANAITPTNTTPRLMQSIQTTTAFVHSLLTRIRTSDVTDCAERKEEREIATIKKELLELDQDLADREVAARDEEISILKDALKDGGYNATSSQDVDHSQLEYNKMQWGWAREQVATQQSAVEAVEHLLQVCVVAGQHTEVTSAKSIDQVRRGSI